MKNFTWRLVLVGIALALAVLFVMPTMNYWFGSKDKEHIWWPHQLINLGLDLQGGMHLILEVQAEEAVRSTLDRVHDDLREMLTKERIRSSGLEVVNGDTVEVKILGKEAWDQFEKARSDEFADLVMADTPQGEDTTVRFTLKREEKNAIMDSAVDQAVETIRNRIDQFGVTEPDIRRQGKRRILVQLPGVTDTKRAKELLQSTAQLQFRLLDDRNDNVNDYTDRHAPPGTEVLYERKVSAQDGRVTLVPYLVKKKVMLTGEYLETANMTLGPQDGTPQVTLDFDNKGRHKFAIISGENVGKRLAIILDNRVYSAPVIREKIAGGSAVISGNFSLDEAKDLAIVLRAGALPAPVSVLEERTVGASLGKDSIQTSTKSMIIGFILVVAFMVVYYMGAGLIADLALVLNVLLILAGLALLEATLTLPGIAGIILTIGMAVDANVLIFERIREERRLGKAPAASVDAGFAKATTTILDANVTTLVAALVLLQFGTGPVKGFAVTLSLGIASSMFTAIVVSRLIFDYFLYYRRVRNLSI